jgi:hypothetical protein
MLTLTRCPHCNVAKPYLYKIFEQKTTNSENEHERMWRVYRCRSCGGIVMGWAGSNDPNYNAVELYPEPDVVDECLPVRARTFLSQAISSIHAPAGSVMLAASAVDAMLKAKGLTEGALFPRINKAVKDHLITAEMATWAHEIRLDANDQRQAELPTEDQAQKCIEFAKALAQFLFVLPARVERGLENK